MTTLRVVEAAPSLLVQDQGRGGWAHLGVPPSGALDPAALALANRLVGNVDAAAGLEVLLGGCILVGDGPVRFALTGAVMPTKVGERSVPWGRSNFVPAGQPIQIGLADHGLRSWLAVAGGIDVPAVLGSRATDTLTGLGPAPLNRGAVVPIGERSRPPSPVEAAPGLPAQPAWSLRVHLGPRDDWFEARAVQTLLTSEYVVAPDSDRVALRLEGCPLQRCRDDELPSEGIVTGAVQVPPSGQPLIFLADHPVTGGYPVIGVVAQPDIAACAQARPGDRMRPFRRD